MITRSQGTPHRTTDQPCGIDGAMSSNL